MRFGILVAGLLRPSFQTTADCQRMCERMVVGGCVGEPVCDEAGICVPLFWTDADREDIVEVTHHAFMRDEYLPVACGEGGRAPGSPHKRRRLHAHADAEDDDEEIVSAPSSVAFESAESFDDEEDELFEVSSAGDSSPAVASRAAEMETPGLSPIYNQGSPMEFSRATFSPIQDDEDEFESAVGTAIPFPVLYDLDWVAAEEWSWYPNGVEAREVVGMIRSHLRDSGLLETLVVYPLGGGLDADRFAAAEAGIRGAILALRDLLAANPHAEALMDLALEEADIHNWVNAISVLCAVPVNIPYMNWLSQNLRNFAVANIRLYDMFHRLLPRAGVRFLLPPMGDLWGVELEPLPVEFPSRPLQRTLFLRDDESADDLLMAPSLDMTETGELMAPPLDMAEAGELGTTPTSTPAPGEFADPLGDEWAFPVEQVARELATPPNRRGTTAMPGEFADPQEWARPSTPDAPVVVPQHVFQTPPRQTSRSPLMAPPAPRAVYMPATPTRTAWNSPGWGLVDAPPPLVLPAAYGWSPLVRRRQLDLDSLARSLAGSRASVAGLPAGSVLRLRNDVFELAARLLEAPAAEQAAVCTEHGDALVEAIAGILTRAEECPTLDMYRIMSMLRLCRPWLSETTRRDHIHRLMLTYTPSIGLMHLPEEVSISVDRSAVDRSTIQQVSRELEGLDRFEMILALDVRVANSSAVGDGPRFLTVADALREAFAPSDDGLFVTTDGRAQFLRPAPLSENATIAGTQLVRFRQVGRLIGIAIRDGRTVPGFLSSGILAVLRDPLRRDALEVADLARWLEAEDPVVMRSLRLAESNPDTWDMFEFPDETPLTGANVEIYVEAHATHILLDTVRRQTLAMALGLYDVVPFGQLGWLSVDELRRFIEPPRVVDRAALRRHAGIRAPAGAPEIDWFFEVVDELTEDQVRRLLRFVSGSADPPIHGFGHGNRTWLQVVLTDSLTRDGLPRAQLCFTQIAIPRYTSKDQLRRQIILAIDECDTLENL